MKNKEYERGFWTGCMIPLVIGLATVACLSILWSIYVGGGLWLR